MKTLSGHEPFNFEVKRKILLPEMVEPWATEDRSHGVYSTHVGYARFVCIAMYPVVLAHFVRCRSNPLDTAGCAVRIAQGYIHYKVPIR